MTVNFRQLMADELALAGWTVEERVLDAMAAIPRHRFVESSLQGQAYEDHPLPIGFGQTISQPSLVAKMIDILAIGPSSRVLEIGAGSGYQCALLGQIAKEVYSVEIVPELAARAKQLMTELNYPNVHVLQGDGNQGFASKAPYQGIIVTAAAPTIPRALLDQLDTKGKLVIPVGEVHAVQNLLLVEKAAEDQFSEQLVCPVRFVPFVKPEN